MYDTRKIDQRVHNVYPDVFGRLAPDFYSSSPEVRSKIIHNICSTFSRSIHSTGADPVMAGPHDDQGSIVADVLDSVPEDQGQQPDNS
jgi:hypothetical protein